MVIFAFVSNIPSFLVSNIPSPQAILLERERVIYDIMDSTLNTSIFWQKAVIPDAYG